MRKLVSRLTAIIAALTAGWLAYKLTRDDSRDTLRAPPRQSYTPPSPSALIPIDLDDLEPSLTAHVPRGGASLLGLVDSSVGEISFLASETSIQLSAPDRERRFRIVNGGQS